MRTTLLLFAFTLAGCGDTTGSTDAGTDAGTTRTDAGPAGLVHCAGTQCAVGEVCCDSPDIVCQPAATACGGAVFACDGTEDCPGEICCGPGGGTECSATCAGYHICHDASECATGESCCPNGGGIPFGQLSHCERLDPGTACPSPP